MLWGRRVAGSSPLANLDDCMREPKGAAGWSWSWDSGALDLTRIERALVIPTGAANARGLGEVGHPGNRHTWCRLPRREGVPCARSQVSSPVHFVWRPCAPAATQRSPGIPELRPSSLRRPTNDHHRRCRVLIASCRKGSATPRTQRVISTSIGFQREHSTATAPRFGMLLATRAGSRSISARRSNSLVFIFK